MPYLINDSISLFLNNSREEIIKEIAAESPYTDAIIFSGDLMEKLRNYYSGLDGYELLLLFNDNRNSLMIGKGTTLKDNDCSFLVRSKMVALAQLIIDKMNQPGFANKTIPNFQGASSINQE
ncbi:hypothetical protein SAMN05444008_11538 [Cnuella takakiae]|uniref:Uncharacterized protein n=1 Tax=Cnuella takakiae TaxID=1302690 RepID=A0A1M5FZQ5_9BACT|nr:hypothetical protein [Cnuella takakiae]OLY92274.1 hypothetical protein BUE76_10510 [Cnuella takakiae]SHF96946.1 hypothetical protein SAMN05444008_11538 [Cnuella takakiae]